VADYPYGVSTSSLLGILGTGTDGAVILDGATSYPGSFGTPAGNVYTMARDVQTTSLIINSGVTVKPVNFRILCQGTLTNNGTISQVGNNAAGSSGAPQISGSTVFAAGRAGGNGGTGVSGAGANGSNVNWGASGGAGGAGTSGAAGLGGTATVAIPNASVSSNLTLPYCALTGALTANGTVVAFQTGPGGGGGGSDASSNAGGGGGGGGGIVVIFAAALANNGSITAAGGNGAAGTGGNAGGGGAGSGGAILIYTLSPVTGAGTTSVAAGALGAGVGTGANGNPGGAGILITTAI